jgi:hypothetical protein
MKICKVSPVSPNPRNTKIEFNFLIIIPGILYFNKQISPEYPRQEKVKFTLELSSPAIPVIPGILYILPLLRHLLCNYTSNNKMKFLKTHVCVRRKLIMCIMSRVNFKGNPLPIFSTYMTGLLQIL